MKKKNILIIIILISLFIYWFQEIDKYNKNKNKKKIIKVVDKIKFPILVASFVYLIFCLKNPSANMSGGSLITSSESKMFQEIFTNQPEF